MLQSIIPETPFKSITQNTHEYFRKTVSQILLEMLWMDTNQLDCMRFERKMNNEFTKIVKQLKMHIPFTVALFGNYIRSFQCNPRTKTPLTILATTVTTMYYNSPKFPFSDCYKNGLPFIIFL